MIEHRETALGDSCSSPGLSWLALSGTRSKSLLLSPSPTLFCPISPEPPRLDHSQRPDGADDVMVSDV